jgi:hypothetical protein
VAFVRVKLVGVPRAEEPESVTPDNDNPEMDVIVEPRPTVDDPIVISEEKFESNWLRARVPEAVANV